MGLQEYLPHPSNSGPRHADMTVKTATITLSLVTMARIYSVYAVPPDNVF